MQHNLQRANQIIEALNRATENGLYEEFVRRHFTDLSVWDARVLANCFRLMNVAREKEIEKIGYAKDAQRVAENKVEDLEKRLDVLYNEAARVEIENRALRRELDSVRNAGNTGA